VPRPRGPDPVALPPAGVFLAVEVPVAAHPASERAIGV
jgi:hypothetical protein